MVKDNLACPLPMLDARVMRYMGRRTKYQLDNMTNAQYGEVYYCSDNTTFYLSIGGNEWLTWGSGTPGPTPTTTKTVFIGALDEVPTSASAIEDLEAYSKEISELTSGIQTHILSNNQHIAVAYKTSECTLKPVLNDGFEVISGMQSEVFGDYTFYWTPEKVYDVTSDITWKFIWEVN